jgi:membrane associated rhomboid family serine protease
MQRYFTGSTAKSFFTPAVKKLIVTNLLVFIVIHLFYSPRWFFQFGLVPEAVISKFALWQLVSYLFLHAGLLHLAINMLMLLFFGSSLEVAWGGKQFLKYYFFCGIAAAVCSIAFAWGSPVPIVGASGAIFGLLVAYAKTFPESVILLFFVFPVKVRYAVIFLAVINLLGAISAPGDDTAYLTHLAGGVFGYFYLIGQSKGKHRINTYMFKGVLAKFRQKYDKQRTAEINAILDKINAHGIKSLSAREIMRLEHFSRKR